MNLFIFLIIIFIVFYFKWFKYCRRNKSRVKSQINIYKWMKMGKRERLDLDRLEKIKVMNSKNKLIRKIREEYFKYKKSSLN